ncbi:MAG: Rieske 2Fe-2S domain-containing protein [Acidimicrobiia bacterium]|nr:Rieske 2Fe-2S domain-containing protein [Acidimicrobiia bacterium]
MTDARPVNTGAYRAAVMSFAVAIVGGGFAAVAYATEQTDELLGLGLAAALIGIGFGLVSWAKYLDLDEHTVQHREPLVTTAYEQRALDDEVAASKEVLGRRGLLVGLLGGSFLSLAVGFVGPLGSLGPKPRGERGRTSWSAGARLVTVAGEPVSSEAPVFGELVTVFPEGHVGVDDSQVILLKLRPEQLSPDTAAGATPDGWVAYSKICTHAGCSVGLFGVDNRPPNTLTQLVCPCHQSVFDPLDGARPVGGPAPRSLPQLGLDIDADGFLVARSDFQGPVGPIAWDEA